MLIIRTECMRRLSLPLWAASFLAVKLICRTLYETLIRLSTSGATALAWGCHSDWINVSTWRQIKGGWAVFKGVERERWIADAYRTWESMSSNFWHKLRPSPRVHWLTLSHAATCSKKSCVRVVDFKPQVNCHFKQAPWTEYSRAKTESHQLQVCVCVCVL